MTLTIVKTFFVVLFLLFFQPKTSCAQEINASDYSSVQEAVKQLPKTGGVVYIPPGTYQISEPIMVAQSNVTLKGAGGSTVLLNTSKGKNMIELRANTQDSLWHIEIKDMHLKGMETSGNAIYAQWINELNISNLWIDNHGESGIVLDHCFENPRISNNNIAYNRETGITLLGPHDIVISANQLEENGTGIYAKDAYNATVTGNNIDDHTRNSIYFDNTPGSIITGNMAEESGKKALVLRESNGVAVTGNTFRTAGRQLLHLIGSSLITISGNTFDRSKGYAIQAEKETKNITVSGNTFSIGRKRSGRKIFGIVMREISNTTITNNTIINPSMGGIYILGAINSSLTIVGNTIINPAYMTSQPFSGIYLQNTFDSIISNNIIQDKRSVKKMKIAIEEAGKSNNNIISHNQINKGIRGALKIIGEDTQESGNMKQCIKC